MLQGFKISREGNGIENLCVPHPPYKSLYHHFWGGGGMVYICREDLA